MPQAPESRYMGHPSLTDWMRSAHRRATSGSGEGTPPLPADMIGSRVHIGEGLEQTVYGFPETSPYSSWVLKESKTSLPQPFKFMAEITAGPEFNTFFTWREMAQFRERDHVMMENLWGKPLIPKSFYFHGLASDGSGRPTNYCLQERLEGKQLLQLSTDERVSVMRDPATRGQLMDIIWGSRYILQTTGALPDAGKGRNIFLTPDNTLVWNDAGIPSYLGMFIRSNEGQLSIIQLLDSEVFPTMDFLNQLEQELQPSDIESEIYRAKYNVDRVAYTSVVNDLRQLRASMSYPKAIGQLLKQKFSR